MKKKRYCATIHVYLYADDDAGAVKGAVHLAEGLRGNEDRRTAVVSVVEHPFGSIHSRDVDLTGHDR